MCCAPQLTGACKGIDTGPTPPRRLIAMPMQFAMMTAAERDGEFVADLAGERPALGKAQVMGVARLPAADQTGLLGDEAHVVAITNAPRLGVGQDGLVDRF